jgi:hypothetical protein
MPQLFARIELRGRPGDEVYNSLHAYMRSQNWSQQITGSAGNTVDLPHATYQGTSNSDQPDIVGIANTLKAAIEPSIWRHVLVLVINAEGWAQSAG